MAVPKGSKVGRWGDLSPRERAARLINEKIRTKGPTSPASECCIEGCTDPIRPNKRNENPAPWQCQYRQASGSQWMAHPKCVDEVLLVKRNPPPPPEDVLPEAPEADAEEDYTIATPLPLRKMTAGQKVEFTITPSPGFDNIYEELIYLRGALKMMTKRTRSDIISES